MFKNYAGKNLRSFAMFTIIYQLDTIPTRWYHDTYGLRYNTELLIPIVILKLGGEPPPPKLFQND